MTELEQRRKAVVTSVMRQGIYEAVVEVLTQHGVDGLTMDRVASQAGVGKASLYKYFADKQEMLCFVHAKAVEPVTKAARKHLNSDLPADQKLEAMLRTWLEYLGEHRALFNIIFNDFGVGGLLKAEELSKREQAISDTAELLQQGVEENVFRKVDPFRTSLLIFGAVRQLVEQQLAVDETWPVDELTNQVMDFFLRGLRV